ncbi:metallophosphoesterase [Pseudonocardia oroxyli]|uniref:Calcineurin-like phosphoesterase n=1 Tax=Pseudonocardia oroxyli TaxID=366584 RepID=A0A1G7IQB7_PSEOR|nr:metallophosphoesterase family protein [Pseudonocardia oroxyli]SDF14509.1 Calcineurin-like phosphoesterase [Pseudonocardia oroxyli]
MATIPEEQDRRRTLLRRSPVSRRAALRGATGAAAALALTAGPWAQLARAQERVGVVGRHLAFGDDPRTTMAIAAELVDRPGGAVAVELGLDPAYGATLPVDVRNLVNSGHSEQYFAHAAATGLAPGTEYHYRFRLADGRTTPDATFRTAPGAGDRSPFVFTAFADQGVNTGGGEGANRYPGDRGDVGKPADALTALVAETRPAFHLLAGDICYADRPAVGSFDPGLWTAYFTAVERSAAQTPWMFATGNHDMEPSYDDGDAGHGYGGHAARLALPTTGPSGCPSVYVFTHGCVGVVSVDANDLSAEIDDNAGYSDGAQVRWLEGTLSALRADPAITFVVVFFHHCAYSTSEAHASDGGVREALTPLFDRFRVDLAVQGHNHQYERTDPIRGGRATRAAPDGETVRPETDGTTYLCVGSGGRNSNGWLDDAGDSHRGTPGEDREIRSRVHGGEDESVTWSRVRYRGYAFLRVEVTPGTPGGTATMAVHAVTDGGEEIDRVDLARPVPALWTPV